MMLSTIHRWTDDYNDYMATPDQHPTYHTIPQVFFVFCTLYLFGLFTQCFTYKYIFEQTWCPNMRGAKFCFKFAFLKVFTLNFTFSTLS